MRTLPPALRLGFRLVAGAPVLLPPADAVLRPQVVVVTMFQPGKDTGDAPGEFQLWVEREKLDHVVPLPAGYHDVRVNAGGSVLGLVTGVGNTNAAATIMALGLDPRFDLTKSYWLIAGIPLSFSIAEGIGLGLIAYAVLHLATGRAKQASPLTYILALIFSLHLLRATLARLP